MMLKIVSFNLRMPSQKDGVNYLPNRIPLITKRITQEEPDVICFQEMEELGYDLLSKALPEYFWVGYGREADLSGEGCHIAVRKKTLKLLAFDQLWLSPNERVPGSRFDKQSVCPRVVTWIKLLHLSSRRFFYVVNTHLDHEKEEARILGLNQLFRLVTRLKNTENFPVFITGDFNFTPHEAPYQLIADSPFSDLTRELKETFHAFGKSTNPVKIDYVLSDSTGEYRAYQWHDCEDDIYLSDHDPVVVEWL